MNFIEEFIQATDHTKVSKLYRAWAARVLLAIATGRKTGFYTGKGLVSPNIFVGFVGGPGAGKTTTIGIIIKILTLCAEKGKYFASISPTRTTIQAIFDIIKATDVPKEICFEEEVRHIFIQSDEINAILPTVSEQLGVLAGFSSLFDGLYSEGTRSQGNTKLLQVCANLGFGMLTEWFKNLPKLFFDSGLSSRFFYCFDPKQPAPPRESIFSLKTGKEHKTHIDAVYSILAEKLIVISRLEGLLETDTDFKKVFDDWYFDEWMQQKPDNLEMAGHVERSPVKILKICILQALSAGRMVLKEEDFLEAKKAFLEVEECEMKLHQLMIEAPWILKMRKIVSELPDGFFPKSKLIEKINLFVHHNEGKGFLRMMQEQGYINITTKSEYINFEKVSLEVAQVLTRKF